MSLRPDIAAFTHELLAHGKDMAGIVALAEARGPDPMLQACAAVIQLSLLTQQGRSAAAPLIARAEAASAEASASDRAFVAAVSAWHQGEIGRATATLDQIVQREPDHLLAAKVCQILQINRGDLEGMRKTAEAIDPSAAPCAFGLGLKAYALQQSGDVDRSLALAEEALRRNAADVWSQHALAHGLIATGRDRDALLALTRFAPSWESCSSFMYTHNWWHVALVLLGLGQADEALSIFDAHVWSRRRFHVQDQLNAISLLLHCDLRRVPVDGRWANVAEHAAARAAEQINPLFDVHVVYALARAGRIAEAETMRRRIDARGASHHGSERAVWRDVVPQVADALTRLAAGAVDEAAHGLSTCVDAFPQLGGSDVQRDALERIARLRAPAVALAATA